MYVTYWNITYNTIKRRYIYIRIFKGLLPCKHSESPSFWDKNIRLQVLFKLTFVNGWNVFLLIGNDVIKAIKH